MKSGRELSLDLARSGLRMPIGADLELHEEPDPEVVKFDAVRLGRVVDAYGAAVSHSGGVPIDGFDAGESRPALGFGDTGG